MDQCPSNNFQRGSHAEIQEIADLDHIDCIATLIAGACIDFKHDGLGNEFHKNWLSERAIKFNNESIQENVAAVDST